MTKWNDIPFYENTPAEEKFDQFERQWEENQAAGQAKAEQDPYNRPHPTGGN